ncbi:SA0570 family protein [Staphylococcus caeli]|uniref:Exported protein n=1 Tax=Staphylococcus caeli TaxID=2201815 RepID=A0A1D4MRY4_9STAP|nr:hypothetical protein [Staphylococcus caeli]SCS82686.1 exported protein [Staphylococcus caeli]SCT01214.1 exported protein [Staphylococcus caeli]
MKKVLTALVASSVIITGVSATNAHAASESSEISIEQLVHPKSTLEGVDIGMPIQVVLDNNIKPIYSHSVDGTVHYYEFRKDNGLLIVTTDGEKDKGKVTKVSMSYNNLNGPSFEDLKNNVSNNATVHISYNKINGNWAYIEDGKVSYQFKSDSPDNKELKLYRIDISQ